jgi:deazaflavin-dependent oxidoreductase (nitroreductase family)
MNTAPFHLGKFRPWQRLIQRLAALRPISWALSYQLPRLDRWMMRRSNGKRSLTTLLTGLPTVILTTTGARSGLTRNTYVVAIPYHGNFVLIASYLGRPHHPDWYYNLVAHPQAQITFLDGQTVSCLARQASGVEREAGWQLAVRLYPGFEAYRRRAKGRQIPVLVLELAVTEPGHPKANGIHP